MGVAIRGSIDSVSICLFRLMAAHNGVLQSPDRTTPYYSLNHRFCSMVLIHSGRGWTRWTPFSVYELSRSHSGPGVQSQHPHTPTVSRGYSCLSLGSSRVAPCKVAIRQRIARSGASLVRHRITSRYVGPNRHFPRALVAVLPPPQPSGDTAQECSTAAVVVPRSTRFSRRFARFPVEPPASARRRHQPGECESRGAQVPRRAFAFASELSNELSVRGDQNNAMHCRKKPRDALSVRTSSCSDVTTHSPLSRRGDRVGRKPATGSQSRMP